MTAIVTSTTMLITGSAGQIASASITSIAPIDGETPIAAAINASGMIVGADESNDSIATSIAFISMGGVNTILNPLAGGTAASAIGINAHGDVVGESNNANSTALEETTLWFSGSTTPVDIGHPTGDNFTVPLGINNSDQIIVLASDITASTLSTLTLSGFIWQNGQFTNLGSLGGDLVAPTSINNLGEVVGTASTAAGKDNAFLWQNGTITDLGALTGGTSSASSINDSGVIVGAMSQSNGENMAVSWQNGHVTNLGILPGDVSSVANFINNNGMIVGESENSSGESIAVLWANGTIFNLNNLLSAGSGWTLTAASAINDSGQVIGMGLDNGVSTSFDLTLPSVLSLTAATAIGNEAAGLIFGPVTITDSASDVMANLNGLESISAAGKLNSIILTDSDIPTLSLTPQQLASDGAVLAAITTPFTTLDSSTGQTLVLAPSVDSVAAEVTRIYLGTLDRAPDTTGLIFWESQVMADTPAGQSTQTGLAAIIPSFLDSPEFIGKFGNTNNDQFVTLLYQNVLDRAPDAGGASFWEQQLASGVSRAQVVLGFTESTEFKTDSTFHPTTASGTIFLI